MTETELQTITDFDIEVRSIRYSNERDGYYIVVAKTERIPENITVCMNAFKVNQYDYFTVHGEWKNDVKFGWQFKADTAVPKAAITLIGIERYLVDNINGIGRKKAKDIVKAFGFDTEKVLDENPEKIKEVIKISDKQFTKIKESWGRHTRETNYLKELAKIGISGKTAVNVYRAYGDSCVERIRKNPYDLVEDVKRIGFKSADKIAMGMGIAKNDVRRIDAGIVYTLTKMTEFGNICYPKDDFIKEAASTLEIEPELVEPECLFMITAGKIICEGNFLYTKELYYDERDVAEYLKNLNTACFNPDVTDEVIRSTGILYTDEQKMAIHLSTQSRLMVLTGGPGTGKTTTVKGIIEAHKILGHKIYCAAPTGRAAKRMNEATGCEAMTIHRLLSFGAEGFEYNKDNKLGSDDPDNRDSVLIVDESSMIDISLMCALLSAIPNNMSLILVGDVDQLPSVGPGTVLKDLINNDRYTKVILTKIQRQAEGSDIIKTAHAFNNGKVPSFPKGGSDVYYFDMTDQDAESVLASIVRLTENALTRYDIMQIQILSPQHTGAIGTDNINQKIREIVNRNGEKVAATIGDFRVGDKVMQTKNNYKLGVYNGDVGIITAYDDELKCITVEYGGVAVVYDEATAEDLILAYACTVHKSQGSEYPVIIMPITTFHYFMLERNLLYTGVTRAKDYLFLCATKKAIYMGIHNVNIKQRISRLAQKI